MNVHPQAGKPAPESSLIDVTRLVDAYASLVPDASIPGQRVAFGTSGHRGSALSGSFNEAHILAITQSICEYRSQHGIDGPLYLGKDTHALSEPAFVTALEVLAANDVAVVVDAAGGFTPTPVISHAILAHNRRRGRGLADGIVITPSHNPPADGGFKYNPPHGGPAETAVTAWIERRANDILEAPLRDVRRVQTQQALAAARKQDFVRAYIDDLSAVVDLEAVRSAGVRLGVDALGGAALAYWAPLAAHYGIQIEVMNATADPTFRFMTLDWDGKIRMDCSSAYAMAGTIAARDRFDIAFGNDADADRHGIVTRTAGLMNPNHYLAVAVDYLFRQRPGWGPSAAVGKTVVSSSLVDRVARRVGRRLFEVPVGFKWFVEGLADATLGIGLEESAGASFLRRDGRTWTTDKDGMVLGLLAAEMLARTGRDPSELYAALVHQIGAPLYQRRDAAATGAQKACLQRLAPADIRATHLAGEPVEAVLVQAPGNGEPIGGVKVVTENGWFAARPSGTEDVYKVYAESFRDAEHLRRIQDEADALLAGAFASSGS